MNFQNFKFISIFCSSLINYIWHRAYFMWIMSFVVFQQSEIGQACCPLLWMLWYESKFRLFAFVFDLTIFLKLFKFSWISAPFTSPLRPQSKKISLFLFGRKSSFGKLFRCSFQIFLAQITRLYPPLLQPTQSSYFCFRCKELQNKFKILLKIDFFF